MYVTVTNLELPPGLSSYPEVTTASPTVLRVEAVLSATHLHTI